MYIFSGEAAGGAESVAGITSKVAGTDTPPEFCNISIDSTPHPRMKPKAYSRAECEHTRLGV